VPTHELFALASQDKINVNDIIASLPIGGGVHPVSLEAA
jgi:hypothetical protein